MSHESPERNKSESHPDPKLKLLGLDWMRAAIGRLRFGQFLPKSDLSGGQLEKSNPNQFPSNLELYEELAQETEEAELEPSGGSLTEKFGIPYEILERPDQYDLEIPYLRRTVGLVSQYERSQPKGKDALLDQQAIAIANNPSLLIAANNNFGLLSQIKPESVIKEIQERLLEHTERAVARRAQLSQWTPEKIGNLVRMGLDGSSELAEYVERMKAALFNAPRTIEEAVDLHYNAAWAMVTTPDFDVKEEIFSIFALEKDWLTPYSASMCYFEMGCVAPDDLRLRRYNTVNLAFGKTGELLELTQEKSVDLHYDEIHALPRAKRVIRRDKYIQDILTSTENGPTIKHIYRALETRNPHRTKALFDRRMERGSAYQHYQQPYNSLEGTYEEQLKRVREHLELIAGAQWPERVVIALDDPLSVIIRHDLAPRIFRTRWENMLAALKAEGILSKLTSEPIQLTNDLQIDIIAEAVESAEQRSEIVREVCESITAGRNIRPHRELHGPLEGLIDLIRLADVGRVGIFDANASILFAISRDLIDASAGRLGSILEFHRPNISSEEILRTNNRVSELRKSIKGGFVRSVGKRGYQVVVADPLLRDFGYKSITFKQAKDNMIQATITIDNQEYQIDVNPDYRVVYGEDLQKYPSLQDQVWLEILVLSHLRKVMCTGDKKLKTELVGGEEQVPLYKRQVIGRTEHLKKLPAGWSFSTDRYLACLKSDLPDKDLSIINRDRGGSKETGEWTYEKGVDVVDTPETKPVKIAFATASDDIRAVIHLAEISDEEMARFKRNLFGELEAA